jgi:hypothetical protein
MSVGLLYDKGHKWKEEPVEGGMAGKKRDKQEMQREK